MRILHVATHTGVYRGGAVQLCRMAVGQRRRGHDVSVVVRQRRRRTEEEERARESWASLVDSGVDVLYVPYGTLLGKLALRRTFKRLGPDIVHAHKNDALVASWLLSWGMRGPALVAQRGTISSPSGLARRAIRSPRTAAVVAVCNAVKNVLTRVLGPDADKVEVVYGSVDLSEFAPRAPVLELKEKLGIPSSARIIGSLSPYRRAKGFQFLMPALGPVLRSRPDTHAVFLGNKVKKRVAPMAAELGIGDRCHFVGHQARVAEWLSIFDVTVMAATRLEGLSGVLRESLAMEVPVVSTDRAGNREIVRDKETGLLVPPRDAGALTEALNWALAHPDEMKRMARAGRKWVEANCSIETQAEKLEQVYRAAVERSAARCCYR